MWKTYGNPWTHGFSRNFVDKIQGSLRAWNPTRLASIPRDSPFLMRRTFHQRIWAFYRVHLFKWLVSVHLSISNTDPGSQLNSLCYSRFLLPWGSDISHTSNRIISNPYKTTSAFDFQSWCSWQCNWQREIYLDHPWLSCCQLDNKYVVLEMLGNMMGKWWQHDGKMMR